jgi:hypothetical protein
VTHSGGGVGGHGELCLRHLPLPTQYSAANWPLRHVALSADGLDVAVSLLGDAKDSMGDAKSSLGDARSSLGDAKSC